MKKIEPTGVKKGDRDIIGFIQERYDDKKREYNRREVVRTYLSKYMALLLGAEATGDGRESKDSRGNYTPKNAQLYTSSLMTEAYEVVIAAKLFPDSVEFESDLGTGNEKDVDEAKNVTKLVDYTNQKGDFDTMTREAKRDMAFGECYIMQEYEKNEEGMPTLLKKKHVKWENVLGFYGDTDLMVTGRLTVGKFVLEYGLDMLKKVSYGDPINRPDKLETPTIDEISAMDRDKTIGYVKYWDPALKRHYVLLGGNGFMPSEFQQEGKEYFWTDTDGTPFCPVKQRFYRKPVRGFHGYGVLDILYPLAYLETVIVNATSHASVLAADPMMVFYAQDISDMKNKWNQYLANKNAGQHSSPFFVKDDRSNPIRHDQIAFQPDINIFSVWRDFVLDEATKRTKIDFKNLTEFAPTAEQAQLRKQETDKTNQIVLGLNADVDRDYALETVYILKKGESAFHDRKFMIEVGDYYYQNLDDEQKAGLKDKNGRYPKVETTVREFLDSVKEVEFNLTPRLDGVLDDQTFFEIQDARQDLALIPPELPAYQKLTSFYFRKKYGKIPFNQEDFEFPQVEQPQV